MNQDSGGLKSSLLWNNLERRSLTNIPTVDSSTLFDCSDESFNWHVSKFPSGGVASPHTEKTLAYIQELKGKHGIDYDTHASYRFVEKSNPG